MTHPKPPGYSRSRRGAAGDSLSGSTFSKGAKKAGMHGEKEFFDKAFQRMPAPLGRYSVWSSMPVPTPKGDKSYSSDVDFVIASGTTLVLVDVKKYAQGRIIWSMAGNVYYGLSRKYKASRNMAAALSRYRQTMPSNVRVVALVVCAPSSHPKSVMGLTWGSGIKTYQYDAGVRRIKKLLGEPAPVSDQLGTELDRILDQAEAKRGVRGIRRSFRFL